MGSHAYDRLSTLDGSFLLLEKPNAYMHVASTMIFEAGPLRTAEGGIDIDAIRDATAASLHLIPRYRQKLAQVPFEALPVWVDDDRFNIAYHIRHTSLPRPGDVRQLKRLSARIMQQHLDRARPLWEIWVVEGLEHDRFALVSKVHHCMVDGVSGVDLLKILLQLAPDHSLPEAPVYLPRPAPSPFELARDAVLHRIGMPFRAARSLRNFVREAGDLRRELAVRARALAETLGASLRSASPTPLNHPIGPHRRFDWLSMRLDDVKEVRKGLGGSLNDVVLAVVAGAVRRFLELRGQNPGRLDFRVMTPVSVRGEDERGALGNRVSAWVLALPIGEADPRRRLARIRAFTSELKESRRAVGAELLTQAAEWTPSTLLALGARNAVRLLPFNMVVTNVPGPQIPMYMLGARMLEVYPHVPLIDNLGLGVALLSYDGRLGWGFNADYDLVPDLHDFVLAVEEAFAELHALARAEQAPAPAADAPVALEQTPGRVAGGAPAPGADPAAAEDGEDGPQLAVPLLPRSDS